MLEICDVVNGMQKVNIYLFILKRTLIRRLSEIKHKVQERKHYFM